MWVGLSNKRAATPLVNTSTVLSHWFCPLLYSKIVSTQVLPTASLWTGPVANVSFDVSVHPFERHHAAEEHRPELYDVLHDMDQQMHHNIKECGWEVDLKLT